MMASVRTALVGRLDMHNSGSTGLHAADLSLLRRYEPVLRFTRGEMFLPMSVDAYLEACSLWRSAGRRRGLARSADIEQLCAPGQLTAQELGNVEAEALPARNLWLRYVQSPVGRREYHAWRRDRRRAHSVPRGGRFAAVGLLARLIDAALRLSLLLRGRVPGGTAAAAERGYRARAGAQGCPYYGRVTRDRGFVALQYWFFYAMNDWRSTFAGVNDHEADWEQVTVFLPDPPDPAARPAWVACSSHDEVGDALRRRYDDPDLTWIDTHVVVFAGAGSHSGAYLPGDYLVTVEPPSLGRLVGALRRWGRLLLPWARGGGTAYGIPFIDYHRGDGPGVGPGEQRSWSPVLIDDDTPWVRDYRGLWGLDTEDPFGGERAPAGPRYERDGSVRLSWSDPVGWAGLDKEAPSAQERAQAVEDRIAELDSQLRQVAQELSGRGDELRRADAGVRALVGYGIRGDTAALIALEASVAQVRSRRQLLAAEREALIRARAVGLPLQDPHAHLRYRPLPNTYPYRTRARVLRAWSAISASLLLAGLAVIVYGHSGALLPALGGLAAVMLCAEAFARGHLLQFIAGLIAAAAVVLAALFVIQAALSNWRPVTAGLLMLSAVVVMSANIRDFFVKR